MDEYHFTNNAATEEASCSLTHQSHKIQRPLTAYLMWVILIAVLAACGRNKSIATEPVVTDNIVTTSTNSTAVGEKSTSVQTATSLGNSAEGIASSSSTPSDIPMAGSTLASPSNDTRIAVQTSNPTSTPISTSTFTPPSGDTRESDPTNTPTVTLTPDTSSDSLLNPGNPVAAGVAAQVYFVFPAASRISIAPGYGAPGTEFQIQLANFQDDESVDLYLYHEYALRQGRYVAQLPPIRIDNDGTASFTLKTQPDYEVGKYRIVRTIFDGSAPSEISFFVCSYPPASLDVFECDMTSNTIPPSQSSESPTPEPPIPATMEPTPAQPVPTEPPSEPDASICASRPALSIGSGGDQVAALQSLLNQRFGLGITVDGQFGPQTESAVMSAQEQYQFYHGPPDGIVGPRTWDIICDTIP